jgi:hypothetical protein
MYTNAAIMHIERSEDLLATTASVRHKHIRIDQTKLDKARKILAAATETEALDRALTLVVSEAEVDAVLREVSRKGKLKKLFR